MKKVLSILMSAVLLLSMTAGLNLTANAEVITGSCGENVTYTLDTETGLFTVSGTGDMEVPDPESQDIPVVPIDKVSLVKEVVINQGVTKVCDYAFQWCSNLERITIPDSVTSIGTSAFSSTAYYDNSANWENNVLYIGKYLIDAKTNISGDYVIKEGTKVIADSAFSDCRRLQSITIPDSVINIDDDAFFSCTSLTSVTIPDSVTSIGDDAFSFCTSLTSVTIPDSVTSIGSGAFYDCTSLTSVTIPDSVTSIGSQAFYTVKNIAYNGAATDPYSNNWGANARNGYVDGYFVYSDSTKTILEGCGASATGEIIIPDTVMKIDEDAFFDCSKVEKVTIPDSVTSIGERAFYDCTSLTSVTIPDSVTSIGRDAFYRVKNIAYNGTATYDEYNENWGANARNGYVDGNLVYSDSTKTVLEGCGGSATGEVVIPDTVTKIDVYAFYDCKKVEKVTIPDSVTSIGNSAFSDCTSLTSVTIGSGVTSIGAWAFYDCTSLTDVYYTSTMADWNNISIYEDGSIIFGSATIHCTDGTINGEEVPTTQQPPTTTTTVPAQTQPTTQPTTQQTTMQPPTAPIIVTTTTAPTTTATTEATPAGAKKVDGVWVNSKYKKTSIKKLKNAKKSFKVTFKKVSGVKGYEIQYSTSKKFTKKTTKKSTIKNNKAKNPSKTIQKLKSKKTYYVRVRSYKTVKVNGKTTKVYSKWSTVKKVKVK